MQIVVTGAAGYLGSKLCLDLIEKGYQVIGIDNFSQGATRCKNVKYINADIRNAAIVRDVLQNTDLVVHLATASDHAVVSDPDACYDINVSGTEILLDEAIRASVSKFVFASCASVFGDTDQDPKTESTATQPITLSAKSKLEAEQIIEKRQSEINSAILRIFNVYGDEPDITSESVSAVSRFIALAKAGQYLMVYGSGENTRDYTHIDDVVAAFLWFIEKPDLQGTYLIGSGKSISTNDLIDVIRESSPLEILASYLPPRPNDILHCTANIDKLLATGFPEPKSVKEGIQLLL